MDGLRFFLLPGLRALRRDWQASELRLLALALWIAVAAVTSVAFLVDRVERAMQQDAAQMLGGDLVVGSGEALPEEFFGQARRMGLDVARTLEFPSMLMHGDDSQLVAVKAVSAQYPLRGHVRLQDSRAGPGGRAAQGTPPAGGIWLDPQLMGLLQVREGDALSLGYQSFRIAGVIAHEPDRGMRFVNVAPRVLMNSDELEATGLLGPGARVRHQLLLAGRPADVAAYENWLASRLQPGQQLQTLENSRPELQRTLDRGRYFLDLVALLTVLMAGVAIALGARQHYLRQQDAMAIMRCLGASRAVLGRMLLVKFTFLAVLASLAGIALAALIQLGLVRFVEQWLDMSLPAASMVPAFKGLAAGVLLVFGFALLPLLGLRRVAPLRLLQRNMTSLASKRRLAVLAGALTVSLLVLLVASNAQMGFILILGFGLAGLSFAGAAGFLVWLAGLLRRQTSGAPWLRLALGGLSRRRAMTVVQVCALSLGLAILLLLGLTGSDLLRGWQATVPDDAPNAFLINIQGDQRKEVAHELAQAGLGQSELLPMVRARLISINDAPVMESSYASERARSMVNREFNLSWRARLPASNRLASGRWLRHDQSEASIETGMARTLNLKLGDTLGFEIAGQKKTVRIVGLRKVKWDSFDVNFFALLSQSVLEDAPATYLTSLRLPDDAGELQRRLLSVFPNITVFDISTILSQVRAVLGQVILAVQLLFLFTVGAGLIVLASAFLASRDERMHEVALLRTLGASAARLRITLSAELLLLGAVSGLLAAAAAQAITQVLAYFIFEFELGLSWWPWLTGIVAGVALAGLGGYMALRGILRASPLSSLRAAV